MAQTAQAADINAAQEVLKEVYASDKLEEQVVNDRILLGWVEKSTEYTVGDKAVLFMRTQSNPRASSRSLNGGTLGAAGRTIRKRLEFDLKATYIQVKILGPTIAKMRTARQAAVREIDDELTDAKEGFKDDLQRQLYGDGTARITACGTTSSSTEVVLDATAGKTAIEKGWLQENMYVDIGTAADEDSVAADRLIEAVDESVPSIEISGAAVTTAATDFVSRSDNREGATSHEMDGLASVTSDTTALGGVDPANERLWKGTRIDEGGALSQAGMQDVWVALAKKGARPDVIVTSIDHQRDYYNLLQAQVRFQGDTKLSSGNIEGPDFNGIPVGADPLGCPDGLMYFLKRVNLLMFTDGAGIEWQNTTTGGDVLDWVQDEDAFAARLAYYANFGTNRRVAQGVLHGIT